ncbi:glycosyltransferase [candidate division FCPU426 bacterium]|nr:glycosyltransferase [candidate division FCPU426 bacterium]
MAVNNHSQIQTTKAPKVSVVMPVFNAAPYLHQAVESIVRQTFGEYEFIIIDDASQDESWAIIRAQARQDRRIIALRNDSNLRLSHTLNRGIDAARGEYIVRMDADDFALPDRLEKQVQYMDKHPEVGISGGSMKVMDARGRIIGQRRYHLQDREIRRHIFRYSPFSHPAVIMRKAVLAKTGLYDPAYNPAEDYELYFRIGLHARFGNLPDTLIHYRVVPRSMTTGSLRRMEEKTLQARKKAWNAYGYTCTWADKLYWLAQYLTMFVIPGQVKVWIFNQWSSWR